MPATDTLSARPDAALLPALYQTDQWFWWSVGMRAMTHALLAGLTIPDAPVLEIGCGGGTFLAELVAQRPKTVGIGMDLNPVALAVARGRYPQRLQLARADLHHLPLESASCGAVVALDAFDQTAVSLGAALAEAWRVLRPDGLLLLRVSAYEWLLGPHDRAFGTGRRYAATTIEQALVGARFQPVRLTHANTLLLLPAIAARLAQRRGAAEVEEQLDTPAPLNFLFKALLQAEARWLRQRDLPVGLSLYAVARKRVAATGGGHEGSDA